MVDRAEFFKVSDEILAEGRQPSLRSIRDGLAKGGSFSDLGPLFVEWAAERGFRPRPAKEDLPKALLDKLTTVAAEIWHDGRHAGFLVAKKDREERDALRQALNEMSARAGALEEIMRLRQPPSNGNRGEPIQAPSVSGVGPAPEPASAESRESRFYWNRVLQEVFDLLGERALETKAIIAEMKKETVELLAARDSGWVIHLTYRMREKARRKLLFEESEDGVFRRLVQGGA